MTIYSFGFNAFGQTSDKNTSTVVEKPFQCPYTLKKVLFASWETTIFLQGELLLVWGYQPDWFEKLVKLSQGRHTQSVFGAPNTLLGIIDTDAVLACVTSKGNHFDIPNVKQAVYCSSLESIFILSLNGVVQQCDLNGVIQQQDLLNNVQFICGDNTHVLFSTRSSNTPLFGLGSNRLSQLGLDYQNNQDITKAPQPIDYFNELGVISDMGCGSFHTAVILNGDVYTFGWSKDGRLGWGIDDIEDDNDMIRCATFINDDDQPVEVNAIKVACGTSHTLVLDDQGTVWSCGSNKYHQLGRDILSDHDPYFRRCSSEKAIDIHAGNWTSFITTK